MILFLDARAKADEIVLEKSLYKDMVEALYNYDQAKFHAEDYAEEERLNHFYLFPEYQGKEKYREKLNIRLAETKYLELLDLKAMFRHFEPVLKKDINFAGCSLSDEHMDLIEKHQSDYHDIRPK